MEQSSTCKDNKYSLGSRRTPGFITVFTKARQWILHWAEPDESNLHILKLLIWDVF